MKNNGYILSVDDEPMNQLIIQEFLSDKYEVSCAYTGAECLESIDKLKPDLLLLDIKMPLMSGLDVCRTIRKDNKFPDLIIIFLTALADDNTRSEAMNAGCNDFLSKPFEKFQLVALIEKYLQK